MRSIVRQNWPWRLFRFKNELTNALPSYSTVTQRLFRDTCASEALTSDHYSGTLAEVTIKIKQRIGIELSYSTIPRCRANLLKHQPKLADLPAVSMKDSYTRAVLPLGDDRVIRERYINHLGRVRLGRLMEELDLFAVWICHRHVQVPTLAEGIPLPYTFVTLFVDKVEFLQPRDSTKDIHFSGHVSWAGYSSMEIIIYARQLLDGEYIYIAKAIFMMVARNATNTGPAPVNPLKPANELEQQCWLEADTRQKLRRIQQAESIFLKQPLASEEKLMYELFRRTKGTFDYDVQKRELPPKCRWMSDSFQTTMLYPYPEKRNAANTIFGGFIMRQAVEISFIAASVYIGGRPIMKYITDIRFHRAVKVNSFLKMTAYVVYTQGIYMQILAIAHIMDANTMEEITTNSFNLTFCGSQPVEEVLPRTYQETIWHIHGQRKLQAVLPQIEAKEVIEQERFYITE